MQDHKKREKELEEIGKKLTYANPGEDVTELLDKGVELTGKEASYWEGQADCSEQYRNIFLTVAIIALILQILIIIFT